MTGPIARAWDRYWLAPAPLLDLDVLRIVAVSVQLVYLLGAPWWWGFLPDHLRLVGSLPDTFYDPAGIVALYAALTGGARPTLSFVWASYALTWVAGLLSLVGLVTRASLAAFALGSVFIVSYCYSFSDFHHAEAILLITLLVLPASPVGRTLSLDALRRRLRENVSRRRFVPLDLTSETAPLAGWPVRLVRVLFVMVYLSAALSKINWFGEDGLFVWANGSTLQYYMVQDSDRFGSSLAAWFSTLPVGVVSLFSWSALVFEGTFGLVLLWPRLAAIYVPWGMGFHAGIYATQRAAFFQYMALYVCFLPASRALRALRQRLGTERALVLYDAQCLLCIRSATVTQLLDWLDRIEYVPLQQDPLPRLGTVDAAFRRRALEEMHVVEPDGSVHTGYHGVRRLVWRLPALWPLLPLLYVPGAAALGSRAYRRVASMRRRFETCDGEACSLHVSG